MADIKTIKTIEVNGVKFQVKPCWEQLGLTQEYMIALLSRDEYTPVATKQPTSTDVLYTDPVSGNPAGFHSGQCVIYPDSSVSDGWGLLCMVLMVFRQAWHGIMLLTLKNVLRHLKKTSQ